ncbi:formimidoylglutamase [Hymenobacter sp. BT186]|uniref:Formimidoylglutamase n=1 Tax=Hymenobacter telluris TaxID=2816474 RepID=A0A939EZC0_9BACT|nr:formimidoylglutamase [Hymenobacter telluris]MBO0359886.1 formimidoylglutamase [Hymenobacter telluris]MBW3375913.1 formimidoylglutamase [Hymenobacter norwichensis]
MNLAIFFDPLAEELVSSAFSATTLAARVTPFLSVFPDWRAADLAVIGLDEWRGSAAGAPATHGADEVRRRFYQLQKGAGVVRLADLGNLRPGLTLEDTYQRLREIISALLEHGTVPILLGGSHDLDYGQFLAYETLERTVSFATIDARVDMAEQDGSRPEDSHLRRMLMHEPNFLFSFAQLAHQQYLVAPDVLAALQQMHFDRLRLGQVRDDIRQAEPLLRHADFVSFDIAAIRWNDAPGYYPANPFGLTNEEAAKLAWYAGLNDRLTSFGLYGYRPDHDSHGLAASVLATMLWYFVEGYYHRCPEPDFQSKRYIRYAVGLPDSRETPGKLVFYKSKHTEKWWLEVESLANSSVKRIIPCSYEDYIHAAQGDMPNRWFLTQALLG